MTGEGDRVLAPRRALAQLREMPDRIELLLRWCPEKDAARPVGGFDPIRVIVGRLGTLDRHHYLESAARIAGDQSMPELPGLEPPAGAGEAELADCELPELLTRFRHVRAQSVDFLETLSEEAWSREGLDPDLGPVTLLRIVTHWVGHDAASLESLSAVSAGLQKS
jgi:hypothetical protein